MIACTLTSLFFDTQILNTLPSWPTPFEHATDRLHQRSTDTNAVKRILKPKSPFLNVGCGAHYHPGWCNIDLVSSDPEVLQSDIRSGLPFEDNAFEAVYHSHVLEHLTPEQGEALIGECYRVLKPGGVLRVVVPDLEQISRIYLEMLAKAWNGDEDSEKNYEWMKLELLDQMVRHQSGGRMGPYMVDSEKGNAEFVRSRIGSELNSCQSTQSASRTPSLRTWWTRQRQQLSVKLIACLLGKEKASALSEGIFRQQGEIHRWMYDRYSLKMLCMRCGFSDFSVCAANQSTIEDFSKFQLDTLQDKIRKPDSLFIECRKLADALIRAA